MRIGTLIYTWDDCGKCVLFDDEHGCKKAGEIETMADDDNNRLVCLTGQMSEAGDYEDIDLEEPWE